ncbi:MAG: ABC transporter ATP-binding protein [Nanoarchaeota archaeon]|nr:ABC transporter ATP-binding protein [Nanoarchaeota archaeon]
MPPLLIIKRLEKRYGKFVAVKDLTLTVNKNEVFGLLGPNGAGKSTLMWMLTGLSKPTSGEASIAGVSIKKTSKLKRVIGFAPQEDSFYHNLTVFENLVFFGMLFGLKKKVVKQRADRLLEELLLTDKRDSKAGSLSGGMKRRLNMAIALIHDPKLLFLDEPTVGVDPVSRAALWKVMERLRKKITIVISTHYLTEAERLCDRVAIQRKGMIIAVDTPKNLVKGGKSLEDVFVKLVES